MACDSNQPAGKSPAQRQREILAALRRLEAGLQSGQIRVGISPTGAVTFQGWAVGERDGVADVCAYRKLVAQSSPALRTAIARAEATSGRRVNASAIAAGVHSHDGGKTWHKGH